MMSLEKRIESYLAQNGSESRLTFRQERRLRKVANRQAKADRAILMAADAVFVPQCRPDIQTALDREEWSPSKGEWIEIAAEQAHVDFELSCAPLADWEWEMLGGNYEAPPKSVRSPELTAEIERRRVKRSEPLTPDYEDMKVVDLRALAKVRGLSGYSKMKRADLIRLLDMDDANKSLEAAYA